MRYLIAVLVLIGGASYVAAQTVNPPSQFPARPNPLPTYQSSVNPFTVVPELQVGGGQTTLSIPGWSIVLHDTVQGTSPNQYDATITDGDGTETHHLRGAQWSKKDVGGIVVYFGTSNADTMAVTESKPAVMFGMAGADTITGGAHKDYIYGMGGADSVDGGDGDDVILGGDGNDILRGDGGDDKIWGEGGNDTINGGDGDDEIRLMDGGAQTANTGNGSVNRVWGGPGADTITGGTGEDLIWTEGGADTINSGAGADSIFFEAFASGTFGIITGEGADYVYLWGGHGQIELGADKDKLYIHDSNGSITCYCGEGDDQIFYGESIAIRSMAMVASIRLMVGKVTIRF